MRKGCTDGPRALKRAGCMTDRLTIALAQMNQRVGDLDGNAAAMLEMAGEGRRAPTSSCSPSCS